MPQNNIFYFVCGKQQWGLTGNDPGDGGASAQLSIPITALIFGQARTTSSEVLSSVFSVDVDNTSTLHIDSSNIQYKGGYAYLIGCKQQWGYLASASSGTSGTTIDLPYPVTYAIGVISTSVGSGADITTSISINPDSQTLAVARRPTSGNVAWFIIGY